MFVHMNVYYQGVLGIYKNYIFIRKVFFHRKEWKTNSGVDAHSKQSYLLSARSTFSNLAKYIRENHHMVLSVIVAKFFQERYQLVSACFLPLTSKGVSTTERSNHLLSATWILPSRIPSGIFWYPVLLAVFKIYKDPC